MLSLDTLSTHLDSSARLTCKGLKGLVVSIITCKRGDFSLEKKKVKDKLSLKLNNHCVNDRSVLVFKVCVDLCGKNLLHHSIK